LDRGCPEHDQVVSVCVDREGTGKGQANDLAQLVGFERRHRLEVLVVAGPGGRLIQRHRFGHEVGDRVNLQCGGRRQKAQSLQLAFDLRVRATRRPNLQHVHSRLHRSPSRAALHPRHEALDRPVLAE
jgi:hypothetical protein